MIGERVFFEENDRCTFGKLYKVWDNGYVKMACVKFSRSIKVFSNSWDTHLYEIDYKWCLYEQLRFINNQTKLF